MKSIIFAVGFVGAGLIAAPWLLTVERAQRGEHGSGDRSSRYMGPVGECDGLRPSGYARASADYHIGFLLGDALDDNCVNVVDILAVRVGLGKGNGCAQ